MVDSTEEATSKPGKQIEKFFLPPMKDGRGLTNGHHEGEQLLA